MITWRGINHELAFFQNPETDGSLEVKIPIMSGEAQSISFTSTGKRSEERREDTD